MRAIRREGIKLLLHTVAFILSWKVGLVKGLCIFAVVYGGGILGLMGFEEAERWIFGWILPNTR
jgi:hypothetical protein